MAASAASNGGVYVPPFAKTTAGAVASAATGGFASIGTLSYGGGASPTTTASSSVSTSIVDQNGGVDANSLLAYFTIPYMDAHSLSPPSWRYAYILWIVLAGLLVLWSIAYQFSPTGSGGLGAIFRKWSIRRAVVGGRKSQGPPAQEKRSRMRASPTMAQMLAISFLIGLSLCLSLIGPDYISPTTCTFGGKCAYQYAYGNAGGPPKSSYGSRLRARFSSSALSESPLDDPATVFHMLDKRGVNNPNGWAPFNDPLLSAPNRDVGANWWTAADRLGLIAFAMFPLAVSLAIKQWPFNIWATPFLTNYHFDKTAIMHRWSGRVIWLFSTGHTAAWARELASRLPDQSHWQFVRLLELIQIIDEDPFGRSTFIPVLQYWRFQAGLVAYGLLCLIVLFSFNPIRTRFYELFYWSHVLLVVLFLSACIIHGHALMWWAIVALVLWGAERFTRLIVFAYINTGGKSASGGKSFEMLGAEKVERYSADAKAWDSDRRAAAGTYPPTRHEHPESDSPMLPSKRQSYYAFGPGQDAKYPDQHQSPKARLDSSSPHPASVAKHSARPPPGYAFAQVLPGRTIRLTLVTPRPVRWSPGQHVFLTVPGVKLLQAHPYTIASIDERSPSLCPIGGMRASGGSEIVLLIRAQKGFSKALWDHVVKARKDVEATGASGNEVAKGVNLRAMISWPTGSTGRVAWEQFESLLIVCGGTGITFGIAVLEYACRRMARRNAAKKAGTNDKYKTTRVRFVWILREHAHLSWVAPALRRCFEISNASQLQVELFVSRSASPKQHQQPLFNPYPASTDDLAPPTAPFARPGLSSRSSMDSDLSDSEPEPRATPRPNYSDIGLEADAVDSVTDFILFDGEGDTPAPALSSRIQKEGKLRRAKSRRALGLARAPKKPHSPTPSAELADEHGIGLAANGRPQFPASDFQHQSETKNNPYGAYADSSSCAELGGTPMDERSDAFSLGGSVRHLMGHSDHRGERFDDEGLVDLSKEDWEDLDLVAELARPGHPNLEKTLDAEIARSEGKTLVACCGPTELNTVVRHLVSSRIHIGQALQGNPRAQVSIVVEDFSF